VIRFYRLFDQMSGRLLHAASQLIALTQLLKQPQLAAEKARTKKSPRYS